MTGAEPTGRSLPSGKPTSPTDWTLASATAAERPLLERLLQLYLYDFSELDGDDVGDDGRFPYPWFDLYGTKPGHHGLILRIRGRPAGFVLLDEPGGDDHPDRHVVQEFFVMRAYRRGGYGTAMAQTLFDRFPGSWQVAQVAPNLAAQAFWRRVIAAHTGGRSTERVTERGVVIQEFDTRAREG